MAGEIREREEIGRHTTELLMNAWAHLTVCTDLALIIPNTLGPELEEQNPDWTLGGTCRTHLESTANTLKTELPLEPQRTESWSEPTF